MPLKCGKDISLILFPGILQVCRKTTKIAGRQYSVSSFQGYFKFGEDKGLPAGHESLKCLSSRLPLWIGDPQFDNKVSLASAHTYRTIFSDLSFQTRQHV